MSNAIKLHSDLDKFYDKFCRLTHEFHKLALRHQLSVNVKTQNDTDKAMIEALNRISASFESTEEACEDLIVDLEDHYDLGRFAE